MFFLAYLNLSSSYLVRSESEQSQGYADIISNLLLKNQMSFIIEFKYIKSNELAQKSDIIEKTQERAKQQLQQYSQRFPNENTNA